uniref:DNA-directed RNA polymerase n=1 Tax=Globodera pallida TaxID=36090 RepID=A0A183BN49_GLOPA
MYSLSTITPLVLHNYLYSNRFKRVKWLKLLSRRSLARPLEETMCPALLAKPLLGSSTSAVGRVPDHIRDAVYRVNARQLQRMVDVHPTYAADVPSTGENGLSNLAWLLLDWAEDMPMQRVVGIVVAAGPFQTQGNLEGFDVRLVFNGPDGQ